MAITAIICEYNPFHNGHAYQLQRLREATGEALLCLMSGAFVQRGEPAIQSTRLRATTAVRAGADLVATLPFVYAGAAASVFALGAVKTLNGVAGIHGLGFGIERFDFDAIRSVADLLYEEPPALSRGIRAGLDRGLAYPRAQAEAVSGVLGLRESPLDYPNNILAVEYLKALRRTASAIEPYPVRRIGDGYAQGTAIDPRYASATALRGMIGRGETIERYLPPETPRVFADTGRARRHFYGYLRAKLLSVTPERLRETAECAEGLEYRLIDAAAKHASYADFLDAVKSKRYTHARLQRLVTAFVVDVRADDVTRALAGRQLYRVPAFRSPKVLRALPEPLLAAADAERLDHTAAAVMRIERRAELLYTLIHDEPYAENDWFRTVRVTEGAPDVCPR